MADIDFGDLAKPVSEKPKNIDFGDLAKPVQAAPSDEIAPQKGSTPESRKTTVEAPSSWGEKALGAAQTAYGAITAPIVAGARVLGGKAGEEWAGRQFEGPSTPGSRQVQENIGTAAESSGLNKLGAAFPALMGLHAPRFAPGIGEYAGAQAGRVAAPLGNAARAASGIASDFRGAQIKPAQAAAESLKTQAPGYRVQAAAEARPVLQGVAQEAEQAAAVQEAAGQHSEIAAREHAQRLEQTRQKINEVLDMPQKNSQGEPILSHADNGELTRQAGLAAAQAWRDTRASGGAVSFPKAEAEAAAKEAAGQYVATPDIRADLQSVMKEAEGIPGLQTEIKGYLSALGGKNEIATPQAPGVPGIQHTFSPNAPPPAVAAQPKTFSQLVLVSRFLHDVVNSGNFQGFSAIGQRTALNTANKLDAALEAHTPAYAAAKEEWAANSKPLADMNTKYGKVLEATAGDSREPVVAAQDLPKRLFAEKEGIEIYRRLLAGKDPTPEALAEAEKTTNRLVENWVLAKVPESGAAAAKQIAPGSQLASTLQAVPKVAESLKTRFDTRAALEASSERLAKQADAARASGEKALTASQKQAEATRLISTRIKTDLDNVDILAARPDATSQTEAINGCLSILERERRAGLITPEKYRAAETLISKANIAEEQAITAEQHVKELQERTKRARRIVFGIAGGIAGVGEAKRIFGL